MCHHVSSHLENGKLFHSRKESQNKNQIALHTVHFQARVANQNCASSGRNMKHINTIQYILFIIINIRYIPWP